MWCDRSSIWGSSKNGAQNSQHGKPGTLLYNVVIKSPGIPKPNLVSNCLMNVSLVVDSCAF